MSNEAPSTALQPTAQAVYFRSRRVQKGEIERPWTEQKDPREKWVTIFPVVGFLLGLLVACLLVWDGIRSVPKHEYCPVLLEDFSSGLNPRVWSKEVEVGGFGNGQFEETTETEENVFIRNGAMWIKPTLQNPGLINSNHTINLIDKGTCTAKAHRWRNCVTSTNTTNGKIVNPVKSARINTRNAARIRYGRVEVVAKLPQGDWLWPAIWMLPAARTYGPWPSSGEIDIMESRGNNYTYPLGGVNVISSALHWGPDPEDDAWWRTVRRQEALHSTYADGYHTFGLEWSEKYLFTYIDTRLFQVLYVNFDRPLWQKATFPPANSRGYPLVDPWSQTGRDSTPFDQDFYLVLNVAVGGRNGWFEDGVAGKPWVDASPTAKLEFWSARDKWYRTWGGKAHMVVKSVKMWQQKGYNGC